MSQPSAALDATATARLRLALARLHRQLVQASGGQELTFAQLSALARIEAHGPLRLSELAARERVAASSLVRTLAPLSAAGMVAKAPDPADGRSSLLALTDHGREVIGRIRRERDDFLAGRIARLTHEQGAALAAVIPVLELLAEDE
jgi:DNA-binding MarR family transcriptional regulator